MKLIDLSETVYAGMPVHHSQPEVKISTWSLHSGSDSLVKSQLLTFSEHTGTHVDALSHMMPDQSLLTIDQMELAQFIGKGICIDLSHCHPRQLIEIEDLKESLRETGCSVAQCEFILIYTNHMNNSKVEQDRSNNPGLSKEAAEWLCTTGIKAFGIDALAPGVRGLSNKAVHEICGKTRVTHYENLTNLHQLIGKGLFTFIGFPLKIKAGSGSPVRAVALLDE